MTQNQNAGLGNAVTKLHRIVMMCCLLLGLSIAGKTVAWALASYTDMRFSMPEQPEPVQLVVNAQQQKQMKLQSADDAIVPSEEGRRINEVGTLTNTDRLLRDLTNVCGALGTVMIFVLVSVVFLGTVLAASNNMPGLYKGISAFIWAVILSVLVLPVSDLLKMPWQGGVFQSYDALIAGVNQARPDYGGAGMGMTFFARNLILPSFCLLGAIMVTWRFHSCIEAGLPEAQSYINPAIDREASEVAKRASTLHGGRSAAALRDLLRDDEPRESVQAGSARQVAPGERPRRLI